MSCSDLGAGLTGAPVHVYDDRRPGDCFPQFVVQHVVRAVGVGDAGVESQARPEADGHWT